MITEEKKEIFKNNLALINNAEFMAAVDKLFNGDISNIGSDCVCITAMGGDTSKSARVYKADIHKKGWINAFMEIGNSFNIEVIFREYEEIKRSQFFHEIELGYVLKYGRAHKKEWDKFIKDNQEEIFSTVVKASQAMQEIQSIADKLIQGQEVCGA